MSRAAERAYEAWLKQHMAECARDLVVGATVYRAGYNEIETGVVRRVARCAYPPWANDAVECDDGEYPYYVAQFRHDWVGQTQQLKWFFDKDKARVALIKDVRSRIDELKRDISRWEALCVRLSIKED